MLTLLLEQSLCLKITYSIKRVEEKQTSSMSTLSVKMLSYIIIVTVILRKLTIYYHGKS